MIKRNLFETINNNRTQVISRAYPEHTFEVITPENYETFIM